MALPPNGPDPDAWVRTAEQMAKDLEEVWTSPEGLALRQFLESQTYLITSLPEVAALEAQVIALEALRTGEDPVDKIYALGDMTRSRADLIARTEVSRTAQGLTQVRSMSLGSTQYIWRTMLDDRVRHAHRALEGRVCSWENPPNAGRGMRYHPGQGPGCRCYAEPIMPRRGR